jgi:SAM-dependent methyltransferase
LLRQTLKKLLRLPANALIASASNVQRHRPYPATHGLYVLQTSKSHSRTGIKSCLPVPPPGVRFGYGDTEEHWLNGGKQDIDKILQILASTNFSIQKGSRILDLGCAQGRMIRWLADLAEECEIWGVDIDARLITWCQENLTPPFDFATVTTAPHLPFEDKYFDLIYCGSVFTHIDDLADAWLLEIKRLLRPGGRVYITILDKHSADLIIRDKLYYPEARRLLLSQDRSGYLKGGNYYKLSILSGSSNCQVFYDIDYVCKHWGRILKILTVTPEAYSGGLRFQTAILMAKT